MQFSITELIPFFTKALEENNGASFQKGVTSTDSTLSKFESILQGLSNNIDANLSEIISNLEIPQDLSDKDLIVLQNIMDKPGLINNILAKIKIMSLNEASADISHDSKDKKTDKMGSSESANEVNVLKGKDHKEISTLILQSKVKSKGHTESTEPEKSTVQNEVAAESKTSSPITSSNPDKQKTSKDTISLNQNSVVHKTQTAKEAGNNSSVKDREQTANNESEKTKIIPDSKKNPNLGSEMVHKTEKSSEKYKELAKNELSKKTQNPGLNEEALKTNPNEKVKIETLNKNDDVLKINLDGRTKEKTLNENEETQLITKQKNSSENLPNLQNESARYHEKHGKDKNIEQSVKIEQSHRNETELSETESDKLSSINQDNTNSGKKDAEKDSNSKQQHFVRNQTLSTADNEQRTFDTVISENTNKSNPVKEVTTIKEQIHYQYDTEFVEKLSEIIKKHQKLPDGEQKIVLNVYPEELGKIEIHVKYKNHRLESEMMVNTDKVKEIIEQNFPVLKDNLESKGVQLDRFDVKRELNSDQNSEKQRQPGSGGEEKDSSRKKSHDQEKNKRHRYRKFNYNTFEYFA